MPVLDRRWRERPWDDLMEAHGAAVDRFVASAVALDPREWRVAPVPGKWSGAEVTMHLVMSYQYLTREQQGEPVIRVLLPRWKVWLLRRTLVPRLLAGAPFPAGARAPREVRPAGEVPEIPEATALLASVATAFSTAIDASFRRGGGRATHPYFGALTLPEMVRFSELHTEHHRRQLLSVLRGAVP